MTSPAGPQGDRVVPIEELFYDDGQAGMISKGARSESAALLDGGIAAIEALAAHPLGTPVPLAEDEVVPIGTLLYRGRAALDRAVELRDQVRGSATPDQGVLNELFDLLELARAE